jgi:hypothetical protein
MQFVEWVTSLVSNYLDILIGEGTISPLNNILIGQNIYLHE